MITKDVKAMLTYTFSYADEIGWKKNGAYPRDAKLSLRNQLKDDLLVFLGYLYDEDSSNLAEQIAFINDSLQITITPENFMRFINDKCKAPDLLTRVPLSLQYFVKDDISPYTRRQGYGIALSRYLLNTFNDVGCYFIAFNGVSDLEAQRLSEYIGVMNEYVASYGLFEKPKGEDPRDAMRREEDEKARSRYRSNEFNEDRMNGLGMSIMNHLGGYSKMYTKRYEDRTYTSSQADIDVAKMMQAYNNKMAGTGKGFDVDMLMSMPTGQVDRSMSVGRDADGSVVAAPEAAGGNPSQGGGLDGRQDLMNRQMSESESLDELIGELNSLIGLGKVKLSLNNLINLVKVRKMREDMGLKTPSMSLHLVFSGNPGTGKTTVARLLARIYHKLGVVSKGQLVEVDRAGLVEGYVGQTAIKTSEVCDKAMGGVLFIDEAYTLTKDDGQDFGQEAVDTLLKRMEDNRDDFIVIVAGYTDEMTEFINSNPGLRSRFNKFIEFPDYNGTELFDIYIQMCESQDYLLDGEAEAYVETHLRQMANSKEEHFANAREVRNYFERCMERQASRIVTETVMDANKLTTFKLADVEESLASE